MAKMNVLRKKAALKKYAVLYPANDLAQIGEAMKADKDANYTDEEIAEVTAQILDDFNVKLAAGDIDEHGDSIDKTKQPGETDQTPAVENLGDIGKEKDKPTDLPAPRAGQLTEYTRYKVVPKYKNMVIGNRKEQVLLGYERTGDPLQTSALEPKHAEVLNQQTNNTLMYWFAPGEDNFLEADRWF